VALHSGVRLGSYQIHSALGAGGTGEVYKATDTRTDRNVAIKLLPPELAGDPQFRDRFDIVSFDPRGIGASRAIRCVSSADADTLAAEDPTADTPAHLRSFYDGTESPIDLAQGCIDRNA
jgi:serine/threonine protein kinase